MFDHVPKKSFIELVCRKGWIFKAKQKEENKENAEELKCSDIISRCVNLSATHTNIFLYKCKKKI